MKRKTKKNKTADDCKISKIEEKDRFYLVEVVVPLGLAGEGGGEVVGQVPGHADRENLSSKLSTYNAQLSQVRTSKLVNIRCANFFVYEFGLDCNLAS